MPKLNKNQQKKASTAELKDGDFSEPLPAGKYLAQLEEVEIKTGPKADYWSWQFKLTEPHAQNRKAWVTSSEAEGSEWKFKEIYHALGFELDSDTDEMLGEFCRLSLTISTIQKGDRAGEKTNRVVKVLPLDETDAPTLTGKDAEVDDEGGF